MSPSILFALGKLTSKKTKGLQETLGKGLVGACPVKKGFLEKK